MNLVNCRDFLQRPSVVREIFIDLCNAELVNLQRHNSLGLNQLLEDYHLDDIRRAFNQIEINNYGMLIIPEQTKASFILRYLEFGGQNVRPTHLITTTRRRLVELFSKERRKS